MEAFFPATRQKMHEKDEHPQLARLTHRRPVLGDLLLTVLVGGGLAALQPLLAGAGSWNLVLFFIGVVALCVFSGVPIAFSFGLASFGYLSLTTSIPLLVMASRIDQGMPQIVLLAVPLFVILGLLMEMTGMAKALVEFLANLRGHLPGGLSHVLVGAMYLVSGISGSKSADMAALAPVLYPEMRARGTRPGEFVALLSATAAQTETIPPSLVLIILGSVTNTSIGALFTGGLLPGLVAGLMLCALVWWRNRGGRLANGAASGERRARPTPREIGRSFWIALPALALPFVIRFAVVDDIATATEVSTIGIV
jgi:tripartite ATP-independent transporter DctM subunit